MERSEGEVSRIGELNDLRQLRIFRALAQTRSFTETAALMSVTQSGVSHSLKSLERTLGCVLFDRRGRSLSLTPEGEILLVHASEVIRELGCATQELDQFHEKELNTLRFGTTDSVGEFILPEVMRRMEEEAPEADIHLRFSDTEQLERDLQDGSIDVMLGIREQVDEPSTSLQEATLFEDCLEILVSAERHDDVRKRVTDGASLGGERILMFGGHHNIGRAVRSWLQLCGAGDSSLIEVNSFGTLKELARTGFGIGLAPPWMLRPEDSDLRILDVEMAAPLIRRRWAVSMRSTRSVSPAEKRFLSLLGTAASRISNRAS